MTEFEFEERFNILNEPTPINQYLSAKYRKSFAYHTMSSRLPIILTQIIDQLVRDKDVICEEFGEAAREDPKIVSGKLSKLKYELQTDKMFEAITGARNDVDHWNQFLEELEKNEVKSYFSAVWLHAECYLYRKIKSIFEESESLKEFDYFRKQKENALLISFDSFEIIAENLVKFYQSKDKKTEEEIRDYFLKVLKLNLWGNRADLSVSAGKEVKLASDPFESLDSLESSILIDQTKDIWELLSSSRGSVGNEVIVDIVNDNAGYELFTDFCLAEFLVELNLATRVRFNVKSIPWFISDALPHDFHWTINTVVASNNANLSDLGKRWKQLCDNGKIVLLETDDFWTSGHEYCKMEAVNPKLYHQLSESRLAIFKGDLNYRKLLGDFNWECDTSFDTALRGFQPSNLCTLRTVKADLICGLQKEVVDELYKKNQKWNFTGEYGVIKFSKKP